MKEQLLQQRDLTNKFQITEIVMNDTGPILSQPSPVEAFLWFDQGLRKFAELKQLVELVRSGVFIEFSNRNSKGIFVVSHAVQS